MTDVFEKIEEYSDATDTDIIAYCGEIVRGKDDEIIDRCRDRRLRKNVLLMLCTRGGDPNAGYRIARCLQQAYKTKPSSSKNMHVMNEHAKDRGTFSVFINGLCKSAGTLICLGADQLVMTGNAELGPIDIQLRKENEVGERESGLTPIQAVKFLENQSVEMFKRHFHSLRFSGDMLFSTKMASEVSTNLTNGLIAPIFAQIDPVRLAEMERSMSIAREYGVRLASHNLKENTLDRLLAGYPSHGFVIDRTEAKELFNRVLEPDEDLKEFGGLFSWLALKVEEESNGPQIMFLSNEPSLPEAESESDNIVNLGGQND